MRPFLGHGMVQRDSYLFGVQRGLGWTVFESPVRVQGEGTGGEIALSEDAKLICRWSKTL